MVYEPAFVETHQLYIARHSPISIARLKSRTSRRGICGRACLTLRGIIARIFSSGSSANIRAGGCPWQHAGGHSGVRARGRRMCALPSHLVQNAGDVQLVEIKTRHTPIDVQFHFAYRRDAAKRRAIRAMLDCFRKT